MPKGNPAAGLEGAVAPKPRDQWPAEPIRRISTVRSEALPNIMWVRVEGESGAVGLGETLYYPKAVAAYIHGTVAPVLLGQDAHDIQRLWTLLYRQWCRSGIGVEARAASAIDVALWDLIGRQSGLPLYQLLGGRSRAYIAAYNSCAGPDYVRTKAVVGERWLDPQAGSGAGGQFEDLWAAQHDPVRLAQSLLDMGITAMKVWPFDVYAAVRDGQAISPAEIRAAVEPIRQIRASLGDDIGIAVELHNLWSLPAARAIAFALEPLEPLWLEDPMPTDNLQAIADLSRSTRIPILASETLGPRFAYRELLQSGAASIIATDSSWVGGVTEAKRVADLASLYRRSFTHHDCSGPVNLAIGVHLSLHAENGFIQEIVRAHYYGWYQEVASGLPILEAGRLSAEPRPGHGVDLRSEFMGREDTIVETTA